MGRSSLQLALIRCPWFTVAMGSEGRDRRLPVALSHLGVAGSIIGQVRVVFLVSPAQCEGREFCAPHVRLQLLERERSIAARHLTYLHEMN